PEEIVCDFYSCMEPPPLSDLLGEVIGEMEKIKKKEEKRLNKVVGKIPEAEQKKIKALLDAVLQKKAGTLAQVDWHLVHPEDHDIVTMVIETAGIFSDHFTHDLFAKEPVRATVFVAVLIASMSGALIPGLGELVGSSALSKAVFGGLLQAQGVDFAL